MIRRRISMIWSCSTGLWIWASIHEMTQGMVMSSSSPGNIAMSTSSSSSSMMSSMPPLIQTTQHLPLARKAMDFIDDSPDPFHAVQTSIRLLQQAGFVELPDGQAYQGRIVPGGQYYYTRNRSTLVAFRVGPQYPTQRMDGPPAAPGAFKVIGCHTDSPNLRIKPRSKRLQSGCIQLGVECYGGGLWHTWFDRDLGVSGRVLVRRGPTIQQHLVKIDRALCRIPNLAIHLQNAKEKEAFAYNKEDHLSPILALEAKKALTGGRLAAEPGLADGATSPSSNAHPTGPSAAVGGSLTPQEDGWVEYQEPALLQVLAAELNVDLADVVDFELSLFDVQKASLGGVFGEFIHSARLDNLASCFLAVQALVDYVQEDAAAEDPDIAMIVLYDHEEVGSASAVGAASPILSEAVRRVTVALRGEAHPDDLDSVLRRSFVLSSDQAHAVHPNYASKHEKAHQPKLNGGMVIKRNSNQRYATNALTGFLMREVARRAGLAPVQEFMVRQDCGCGSTIGPLISTATGIRAIDMGCPQLSMHSIRESMGVADLTHGLALFKAYYEHFAKVDASVQQ